jgi:hypothetical protein
MDRGFHLSQMLDGRQDVAKIVIISVSTVGTCLLLLNIFVVSYFIYKKKNNSKGKQEDGINTCFTLKELSIHS